MRDLLRITPGCCILLAVLGAAWPARAQPPPGKGTDMELDPDAKAKPPPEEKTEQPLPPAESEWGVGGKEEDGKYAPGRHGEKPDEKTPAEKEAAADDIGPPGAGRIDAVIGFGDTRDVLNDSNVTSATLLSMLFSFKYRFGKTVGFAVRFPFATGTVDGPGGPDDKFKATTVGNFELSGGPTFRLSNRLRLPIGLALDIPVASGDSFPEGNNLGAKPQVNINYAASASRGFEEMALFASKRFGLVPSIGLLYDKQAIHFGVSTKFEAMFKSGGGDPPAAPASVAKLHNPNTNWVTGLSFFYGFLANKISPGLRTWLAVATLPVSSGTIDYSGVKWVAEPDIVATLPLNDKGSVAVQGGVGYIFPIAGNLGGSASASGLRADVALLF